MKKLLHYLNPIRHLGEKKYSYWFPLFVTVGSAILLELYAMWIARNPDAINLMAIFLFIAYIIYFSFREGIRGGLIVSALTVLYYLYIIYSRQHSGSQLVASIETTIVLGFLYFLIAWVIGWLKETIDDLIEREADEKRRLQSVIQQLPVGVIITDSEGKIVQANKKADAILGAKVPLGYPIREKIFIEAKVQGRPLNLSQSPIAQTLASGKPVTGQEMTISRKDSKQIQIQVSASAIHNKDGKIIAAASILTDITQQKEIEKRKDDFVNMASHELKTPITSMKLYIDSLMSRIKNTKDERSINTLVNIKNQTKKLQKLVNDLLDVSRLQTGKLAFNKELFDLTALVEESVEALRDSTKKQQLTFIHTKPIHVYADKFRIYQVITNLITNAIKYSPEGSPITLKIKTANHQVVVSIKDLGIGISKEQQKKIFERLYQVTDDTEKTFPGFGMGLYIAREIIKRHKGTIWVESEKGKGSIFYFSLPIPTRNK